jgi:hypothetical protein
LCKIPVNIDRPHGISTRTFPNSEKEIIIYKTIILPMVLYGYETSNIKGGTGCWGGYLDQRGMK